MSRSRILASFSSSRQMMTAWKVSGLSHRPAIIASRPASMRLAMAISPSRESSSTEPMSRRYMRTGSSVRSVGSARVCVTAGTLAVETTTARLCCSSSSPASSPSWGAAASSGSSLSTTVMPMSDSIDMVSSIWSGDTSSEGSTALSASQRHEAARLGGLDELLDRRIRQVEKGAVLLGSLGRGRGLVVGLRCHCHSITPGHAAAAQRAEEIFTGSAIDDWGRARAHGTQTNRMRRRTATLAWIRKAPSALARRPSFKLACPSGGSRSRHTQPKRTFPVFFFCIDVRRSRISLFNGRGRNTIPAAVHSASPPPWSVARLAASRE